MYRCFYFYITFGFVANIISAEYNLSHECDEINDKTLFGHHMLKYFQIENGFTNINHGSYGSVPKCVADSQRYWRHRMESCPDRWFRYELPPQMAKTAETVAKLMNVKDSKDLAYIPNASAGINAVIRSIRLNSSDMVLFLSEAYGAVKKTIQYATDHREAEFHEITLEYPFNDAKLVKMVEEQLIKFAGRVKLASFSHISSVPSAIFPVKQLTQLCRNYSVYALIDGAQALGQIKVDIQDLDPDFYLTSSHKWFYTPIGSAVLYVKKHLQHLIHPGVISWNYQLGFQKEFHQLGTLDYTQFLTFPAAIEFRRRLGEDRIINYIHSLAVIAGRILSKMWKTEMLIPEHQFGAMVNVRLPINGSVMVTSMVEKMFLSYGTFIASFEEYGVWYARISAQIYNEDKDYEDIGRAVLETISSIKNPSQCNHEICS